LRENPSPFLPLPKGERVVVRGFLEADASEMIKGG